MTGATLGVALAVGVVAAVAMLVGPLRERVDEARRTAAIDAALSAEADDRASGWVKLAAELDDDRLGAQLAARIEFEAATRFHEGRLDDAALAELAIELDRRGGWNWADGNSAAIRRSLELAANAEADPTLVALAVQRLIDAPAPGGIPASESVAAALWNRLDPPLQRRLLPRLASMEPESSRAVLLQLLPPTDASLANLLRLARLCGAADPTAAIEQAGDPDVPAAERDRAAAVAVRLDPELALTLLSDLDTEPTRPWATILAPAATDPAVRAAISGRAAGGDSAAKRLLARLEATENREPPEAESLAAAWDLLSDPDAPIHDRRIAALVLLDHPGEEELPEPSMARLLEGAAGDADGSVLTTALLAEAIGRPALAARWLRDFDDERKRAGALLAVLNDGRGELAAQLDRTAAAASDPQLRSFLRAAMWARAAPRDAAAASGDRGFVHRIAHRPDRSGLDLEVLALMLASGDPEAVDSLIESWEPEHDADPSALERWSERMALRWLLLSRFVPGLAAELGPPLGGSRLDLELQADLALTAWWALRSRSRFDPAVRRWTDR